MRLWGSRMGKDLDQEVAVFSTSINEDQALYRYDILGSLAHSQMLLKIGILTQQEALEIQRGLLQVMKDIESKRLDLSLYEDIHSAVEINLKHLIG